MWFYFSLIAWGHLICGVWSLIYLVVNLDIFNSKEMNEFIENANRNNKITFHVNKKIIVVAVILGGYFSFFSLIKIYLNTKS